MERQFTERQHKEKDGIKQPFMKTVIITAVIIAVFLFASIALLASECLRHVIIQTVQDYIVRRRLGEQFWQEYIIQNCAGMTVVCVFLLASLFFARNYLSSIDFFHAPKKRQIAIMAATASLLAIGNIFPAASAALFMCAFYALIFAAIKSGGERRGQVADKGKALSRRDFRTAHKAALAVIFVFFVVFTLYWARQNNSIYDWDYGGYWERSIKTSKHIFSSPLFKSLFSLYLSINNDTRNTLLSCVISLPIKLFGQSYSTYIFINCIMFLLPAILVQGLIAIKLNKGILKDSTVFVIAVVFAALFPANYYAAFAGYIDVACLLSLSCAVYLFVDYDITLINIKKDVLIALMLCLSWLERRYVIYFIIGYAAAFAVKALTSLFCCGAKHKSSPIKNILLNLYIIGGVSLIILVLPFGKFVWRALTGGYSHAYKDFDAPLAVKMLGLMDTYSAFAIAGAALAAYFCIKAKKHRVVFLSLVVLAAVETVLFWHTQDMGPHHKMLLNLPIFVSCLLPLCLYQRKRSNRIVAVCIGAVFALNFISAFCLDMPRIFSHRHHRLYRDDKESVLLLANKLEELTQGTDKKIYVASTSGTLSGSVLQRVKVPNTFDALDNIEMTNTDMRDGFNVAFFTADYCVVTDPIEGRYTGNNVPCYLSAMTQDDASYIGRHYKEIYQVTLQYGIKAKVYERISGFTYEDKKQISDYFDALYPNDKELFSGRIMQAKPAKHISK